MARKGLGMLHTLNQTWLQSIDSTAIGNKYLFDMSSELSEQLQRNIRQMSTYKVVGLDIAVERSDGFSAADKFTVSGNINYFAPTRGRVAACKMGYYAVRNQMKQQGVRTGLNKLYDFRITPELPSAYVDTTGKALYNTATLNGINPLTLLDNDGFVKTSLFETHNEGIEPLQTNTPNFSGGLAVSYGSQTNPNDFVLNEGLIQEGRTLFADTNMESIPFQVTYDPDNEQVVQWHWEPDPQLYLSVLLGHFTLEITDVEGEGEEITDIFFDLNMTVEVAGWKSILGSRKSRKSRKSRSKKSSKKKMRRSRR